MKTIIAVWHYKSYLMRAFPNTPQGIKEAKTWIVQQSGESSETKVKDLNSRYWSIQVIDIPGLNLEDGIV